MRRAEPADPAAGEQLGGIEELLAVMRRLRDPVAGCPWDIAQTFASIAPYTIEEAYELADAIAREDWPAVEAEAGDLLLQVAYYGQMGAETGRFDFDSIARGIAAKMVARHPHIFADTAARAIPELHRAWEEQKAVERAAKPDSDPSALADVPLSLPALSRALKLQKRARRVGFDWPDATPVLLKLREELAELEAALADETPDAVAAELGDLLFTLVNLARHLHVDPESALRATNRRFENRFRTMEAIAARDGHQLPHLTADALETLWQQAKQLEAPDTSSGSIDVSGGSPQETPASAPKHAAPRAR